jgi:hypothetical protein
MNRLGFLQCEWPASAFVGANLFQSGFTRFCPLETILVKLGVAKPSPAGSCA